MGWRRGMTLRVLVVLGVLGYAKGECKATSFDYEDHECPAGMDEMYKEVEGGASYRWCCTPDDEHFAIQKSRATACRTTECGSGIGGNLCSSLRDRYVGGKKVEYEEILRSSCTRDSGTMGAVGLCCMKGSVEGILATTMGAEENEFPFIAKLKVPGHCGGTIYNKRFIITAAHCIVGKKTKKLNSASAMEVILGTNIADVKSKDFVYKVKKAIPHPKYSRLLPNEDALLDNSRIFNDIALLELDRDINFGPNVKSLEIAPEDFQPLNYAKRAVIAGWGTTDTMDVSVHLQKADFLIRSDEKCFKYDPYEGNHGPHARMYNMTEQLLCVGGIMEGKWSPTAGGGDSGGPAVCRGPDGRALLCGVTSYGGSDEMCAKKNDQKNCPPSVYAEVSHFRRWIVKNAGQQDPSTFFKPYLYGQVVSKGTYEHQVHITSVNGKPCGGTLVAPEFVVTAASCVAKSSTEGRSGIKVTTSRGMETFEVAGVAILANFAMVGKPLSIQAQGNRVLITDNYYKNDLAVLKLKGKTSIPKNKLAELPVLGTSPELAYEVSRLRNSSKGDQLVMNEFRMLDRTECQVRMDRMKRAKLDVKVDKNLLCGVEKFSGGSRCDRELGGGLMCKGKTGKDVLCGVQVFRLCEWSIPNGFMNMILFSDWVRSAMKQM